MNKPLPYPPIPSEEEEQKSLFRWIDFIIAAGTMPELEKIFGIPNEGSGSQRGMSGKMKAMGRRKGVSDIFWPCARGKYHGLFIEMKRFDGGGGPTDDQVEFLEAVNVGGYLGVVANGKDEAQDVILGYYNLEKGEKL